MLSSLPIAKRSLAAVSIVIFVGLRSRRATSSGELEIRSATLRRVNFSRLLSSSKLLLTAAKSARRAALPTSSRTDVAAAGVASASHDMPSSADAIGAAGACASTSDEVITDLRHIGGLKRPAGMPNDRSAGCTPSRYPPAGIANGRVPLPRAPRSERVARNEARRNKYVPFRKETNNARAWRALGRTQLPYAGAGWRRFHRLDLEPGNHWFAPQPL